ncbi:pentatricopeptide repeat-containing protein At1g11290, chloroplastic-like [Cornus florida]|uniref:pentatricopeptide repeat-containing protein At1g11290, chloroplastic-like n=1 Tax=Cornus florida TaxID=4283 RepID=UPI0028A20319|nr:pentatricopeptide repeat-containing protein At1g11290, chloroplastic-like [Cornus florida]
MYDMYPLFQNAYKLFDGITQRHPFKRNSIFCLAHSTLCRTHSYFGDPTELFAENEKIVSWTSKISGLVRRNKPEDAIALFKTMLMKQQRPNYVTILSVIRAVGLLSWKNMIKEMHGLAIKMGCESETTVVTALLGIYSTRDMEIVWKLFDQTDKKDVVLWSAMVSACVRNEQYMEAFKFLREMQFHGVQPNHVSLVSILPACADLAALSFGKQIHGFSIKRLLHSLTNVQNSLVDMYAKCGNLEASIRVFNKIVNKDLISWRTMIRGCVENESPRIALTMFSNMRTYCFELDETIIRDAIAASIQAADLNFGLGYHCFMLKSGFLAFVSVVTALLQMYAKFGRVELAMILFNQIHQKDLIAWTAMISAYAQSGHPGNALDTYRQMKATNEIPNEITFVSLLQACSSMDAEELGESIHGHVTKAGYSSNAFLTSALIDFYCKFGRIKQGKAIFDDIPVKDLICWSSMINGYGINGCGSEALETLSNMLDCGIKPNDIVFISVLSACSHCGLEYEGWNWFYAMEEIYGIMPKLAHYACMVDLLSRRGNIEEALEFVNKMPIAPDKRIWGALLAGCRLTHGYIDIAELVAEQLIGLDPQNTSYYVILSNLYADQGRWEDVERLRKMVDMKGLRKELGYSMIESNL